MVVQFHLSSRQVDLLTEFDVIASLHQRAVTYLLPQARQSGSHHQQATDLALVIVMLKVRYSVQIFNVLGSWQVPSLVRRHVRSEIKSYENGFPHIILKLVFFKA